MRKLSNRTMLLLKQRQVRQRRNERRAANIRRHNKRISSFFRKQHAKYFELEQRREIFRRRIYHKIYNKAPITVDINGSLGIEDGNDIEYFLRKASEIIDFNNSELDINLKTCTRVWPSAVTLFCSLMQWVELSTKKGLVRPVLASTRSDSVQVNSYLKHCGFFNFVKARTDDVEGNYYQDTEIVKIQRETKLSNIEAREIDIVGLLKEYSALDFTQIELFDCKVLTEAFNNVTEHGVSHRDKGWWLLAQYHKAHGFISLCIADNGIGIRNTLMTGPQSGQIEERIENKPLNDDKFIRMALEETVSGALYAPQKTAGIVKKKYERGVHRGNGLKRIKETCTVLNIPFAILSHHGYAFLNENGKLIKIGSMERRVFAGTLNHFLIPARTEVINANY